MLTVNGNLSQAMTFEDFKEIQPVVIKTSAGGMLPSPEEIPGYSFTGYYFEIGKTCTNKSSSIKIEERGDFTPGLAEEKTGVEEKVVVSEKGEPLVQPENPELETEPKHTPENPLKPIRETPTSDVPPKYDIPLDDPEPEPSKPVRSSRPCEIEVIPYLASDEKPNPLGYKTIYEPDPYLEYEDRQEGPSCDKIIILVGNVERIVKPIEITEERKDDPELPKGMEVVIGGVRGKTTITRTYEFNPETGELTNPKEETEITRLMIPRLILVGTKEEKSHL